MVCQCYKPAFHLFVNGLTLRGSPPLKLPNLLIGVLLVSCRPMFSVGVIVVSSGAKYTSYIYTTYNQ